MARRRKKRKKGPRFRLLAGALFVLAVAVGLVLVLWPDLSAPGAARGRERGPLAVSLFLTCNLGGRLMPCGCEEGELGGVARAASIFSDWATERADHIVVDAGNATVGTHPAAETVNRFTFEALEQLGCTVVNCGANEVRLGAERLAALTADRSFRLISANWVDAATGQPFLPPTHLLTRGGLSIGFLGLVDDRMEWPGRPDSVRLLPPRDALARELPALEKQADLIVVLGFLPPARLYELAQAFPSVAIFLGGRTAVSSGQGELVDKTAIAYLGDAGCSVGRLDFDTHPGQVPHAEFATALLDEKVPADPAMARLLARFTDALGQDVPPGVPWDANMPCTGSYVGSAVCYLCHREAFYKWYASDHAGAYGTLLQQRKHKDRTCLPCHTTGYGRPGGYDPDKPDEPPPQSAELARLAKGSPRLTQHRLKAVGCECCHGGARRHLGEAVHALGHPDEEPPLTIRLRPRPALHHCSRCHHPGRPCVPEREGDPYTRNEKAPCGACDGSGKAHTDPCPACKGTGRTRGIPCENCGGTGRVGGVPCPACQGTGKVPARQRYLQVIKHWDLEAGRPGPASR